MEEELDNLYQVVSDKGLYTKSLEEFKTQYSDSKNQDKLFKIISDRGYYTKTREEFQGKYFSAKTEPVKKKEELESSVSDFQSGISDSGSVLVSQDLNIPVVDADPALKNLYEGYMKSATLEEEQAADISNKITKQKEGDRSLWETTKAITKGFLDTGVALPLYNFDEQEDLVDKRAAKNKIEFLEEMSDQDKARLLELVQNEGQHLDEQTGFVSVQNRALEIKAQEIADSMSNYTTEDMENISQ